MVAMCAPLAVLARLVEADPEGDIEDAVLEHLAVAEVVLALGAGGGLGGVQSGERLVGGERLPLVAAERLDEAALRPLPEIAICGEAVEPEADQLLLDRDDLRLRPALVDLGRRGGCRGCVVLPVEGRARGRGAHRGRAGLRVPVDHRVGDPIGLQLGSVAGLAHRRLVLRCSMAIRAALLDGVDQLVGDQAIALAAARLVLPGAEVNVLPGGVGACAHPGCSLLRRGAGVNPHSAEIGAGGLLHRAAHRGIERRSAALWPASSIAASDEPDAEDPAPSALRWMVRSRLARVCSASEA